MQNLSSIYHVQYTRQLFNLLLGIFCLLCSAGVYAAPPSFSVAFSPTTIGPGSSSVMTYTIDHSGQPTTLTGLTFSNTLPAGLTINSPSTAITTCRDGSFSATDGSNAVSFSDYRLGAGESCTLTLRVTGTTPGAYVNTTGALSTSEGSAGTDNATLTIDGSRAGFSMAFSPTTIHPGAVSTLTYTINNGANGSSANGIKFTHTLPNGLTIANPPNITNTCGGTPVADAATILIKHDVPTLATGASCTYSVDITSNEPSNYITLTGNLTHNGSTSSGPAIAALHVDRPFLYAAFPTSNSPGTSVELTYTINNTDRSNAANDITFTNDLNATLSGMTAKVLPANGFCGTGSTLTGSSTLTIAGANLAVGGSCTFNVTVNIPANAAAGSYTNTTSTVNLTLGSPTTKTAASNTLVIKKAPTLSATFIDDPASAGKTVTLRYVITNTDSANDATAITFTENVNTSLPETIITTLPNANSCGTGSTFTDSTIDGETRFISVKDATVLAGSSCTFDVILTLPSDAKPNSYPFTTSLISATVSGSTVYGLAATDNLIVIAAPKLTIVLSEDYTLPNSTLTAEFTLDYGVNATADATGVGFDINLDAALSGLTSTSATQNSICGSGSSFGGTSTLNLTGASLSPGGSCTFSVTLSTPATPGVANITSSVIAGSVSGTSAESATATSQLVVSGLSFSRVFSNNPTVAGAIITIDYTISNHANALTASDIEFTDKLHEALSGFQAISLPTNPCNNSVLPGINGSTSLTLSKGVLNPGQSCSFSVTVQVPAGATEGIYNTSTSNISATVNSINTVNPPTTTVLTIESLTAHLSTSASSTTNLSPIPVSIHFNRPITNFTAADLTITNGTASNLAGSELNYTVDITPTANGIVTINLPAAMVDDVGASGVTNPASNTLSLTYDSAHPVPGISIGAADASIANTGPVNYTVTYTNTTNISLTNGAIILNSTGDATATPTVTNGTTTTPTVTLSNITGNGTLGFTIDNGTARNDDTPAIHEGPSATFTVDNTAPTVTITDAVADPINVPYTATFTFSEAVTGFSVTDITAGNATLSSFNPVSTTVYTATVTPTNQGTVTLDVAASLAIDSVGNGNAAASQYTVTYDSQAPTVLISSPSTSVNAAFVATFTFDEDVTGFSAADISVSNATQSNFTATSAQVYTATFTPTSDGPVTLNAPASSAVDNATNPSNVATQYVVTYDTVQPTLSISGPSGPINAAFTATFTFNEDVTGFAIADISATNATLSNLAATSGAIYTATVTPTADGNVTVDVAANVAIDAATNSNTVASQYTVVNDIVKPTVVIDGPKSSVNAGFTATFTFSEDVTGFSIAGISVGNANLSDFVATSATVYSAKVTPIADGNVTVDVPASSAIDVATNGNDAANQFLVVYDATKPTVVISSPSTSVNAPFVASFVFSENVVGFAVTDINVVNATLSNFASSSASAYTVTVTPTSEGNVSLNVAADVSTDLTGNGNTVAAQYAVGYDLTQPTLNISGPGGTVNAPVSVNFDFSEAVTGFTIADINVTNGTLSNFANTSSLNYSVTVTPTTDGTVTVDVPANIAIDAASNNNTAATQYSVGADFIKPTVVITGPAAPTNAAFTATFTFSEPVAGFVLADITVGNGTASNFVAGSTSVYTATITPTTDGNVTLDVAVDVANDAATNGNAAATQFSVLYDVTSPTLVISSVVTTINSAFTATFTFNEAVTGFALSDIAVTNGALSNFAIISSTVYTATVTPVTDGAVTLNVPAGVVTDSVGNATTTATQYSVTYDITSPTLAITGPTAPANAAFTATFTFSEAVSGFDLTDISAVNGVLSNFATTSSSVYTATVIPNAGGTMTLDVAASAAIDSATNGNTAASQFSVAYDPTTITISGPAGPINAPFTATFTFNAAVTGFTSADISATNATVSNFAATSSTVYTAIVTPTADGSVTLDVAASVVTDNSGNNNTAASQYTVAYDMTLPTLAISGPAGLVNAAFVTTFTFSEDVSGFAAADIVATNASISGFAATDGKIYTATITPTANGEVTVNVAANVATDTAGNANAQASQYSVTYDISALTATLSATVTNPTNADFDLTMTFNKVVTGLALADFTLVNTTVSNLLGSGSSYTITVNPIADGNVSVTLPSGSVQDAASNINAASNTFTVINDRSAPLFQSSTPVNNAIDVSVNTNLNLVFDETVVAGTSTGNNLIEVKNLATNALITSVTADSTAVSISGSTATITLPQDLPEASNYYVTIGNNAFIDLAGNAFGGFNNSTTWGFNVVNLPPVTVADTARVDEDSSVQINVLSNDDGQNSLLNPASVMVTTAPANGSTTVNAADGVITYQPNENFNGSDSFSYNVSDMLSTFSASTTVTVHVNSINDAPVAISDTTALNQNGTLSINVLSNDNDIDGSNDINIASLMITEQPQHGQAFTDNGQISYQPDNSFSGTDTLAYTVADNNGAVSNIASVSINVVGSNSTPVALADTATTNEDTPVSIAILDNDSDSDGQIQTNTVAIITQPTNGTVSVQSGGTLLYTPQANFFGSDSLSYTVKDNGDATSANTLVSITVNPVNDAPVAKHDNVLILDRTAPLIINVTGNDEDVDSTVLTLAVISGPQAGSIGIDSSTLLLTYTPATGFTGSDSFSYQLTDDSGLTSAVATVTLSETPFNNAPLANDDVVQTDEDLFAEIDILANDSDIDGRLDTTSVQITTNPSHGTANVRRSDGHIFYVPTANFSGDDTLVYQVADDQGATATATVTIQVNNVNDTPAATSQSLSTNEDTAVGITLAGTDIDNDPLNYTVTVYPVNGTLSGQPPNLSYQPDNHFNGSDSITFMVNDGTEDSATATVNITVVAQNDIPVANGQTLTLAEDNVLSLILSGSDIDNDTLSYRVVSQPVNGQLSGSLPNLNFTPSANFNGTDSFTFVVNDGTTDSPEATVALTITSVNDQPTANNQTLQSTEDTTLDITLAGADIDSQSLSYSIVTPPLSGQLLGSPPQLQYVPNLDFNGSDSFTFLVNDGALNSSIATVTLTVTPVNDPPLANALSLTIAEDLPLSVFVSGFDVDGDSLSFAVIDNPSNGILSGLAPNLIYTPNSNFNGRDSFTFQSNDGNRTSPTTFVNINVTAVNDAPVATDDNISLIGWAPLSISPLINDTDIDGDTLVINGASVGSGALTFSDSQLDYTPINGFVGAVVIEYNITDNQGGSDTGQVLLDITAPPDNNNLAQIHLPPDIQVNADGLFTLVNPGEATATDIDGSPIAVSLVDNNLYFKPGLNTVLWQATSSNGITTQASQLVKVEPLISLSQHQQTLENSQVTVGIHLNGLSPQYPLTIAYTVGGTAEPGVDHNLTDGEVVIESGSQTQLTFSVLTDSINEGQETIVITLDDSLNLGEQSSHTLTISEGNLPPQISLNVTQSTRQNVVVNRQDGLVNITANIQHPNPNNQYRYQWVTPESLTTNTDTDMTSNHFDFDPTQLLPGIYPVQLTVVDIDDEQYQTSEQINIKIEDQAVVLSNTDSDNDGIADDIEGASDSDHDGIADYLDNIAACNVMPANADSGAHSSAGFLVEGEPGICLRLGGTALTQTADNAQPQQVGSNAPLFDVIAYQLPVQGQRYQIVLPQTKPLTSSAQLKIPLSELFDAQDQPISNSIQWADFVQDADNQLMSSPGASGYCPPPGDERWQPGLTAGHWCVQLQISDGGPNDTDKKANGMIAISINN